MTKTVSMMLVDDENNGEDTVVHFEGLGDDLTTDDLLELFVRFVLAAGRMPKSVEDAILQKAFEIEPMYNRK